jgi:hypothetical protein
MVTSSSPPDTGPGGGHDWSVSKASLRATTLRASRATAPAARDLLVVLGYSSTTVTGHRLGGVDDAVALHRIRRRQALIASPS